jgi:hypothetical protein
MALQDINFNNGDNQQMILEMNRGNVGVLVDVLTNGGNSSGIPVLEVPQQQGGSGNTFIYFG